MRLATQLVPLLVGLALAAPASGQELPTAQTAQETAAAADPITCWWRTTVTAVRVGEPLDVVLTCSVLETDTVKIIPDESPLEANVMQLAPFEVIGGAHHPDQRAGDRRFFQYSYRVRIVSEDAFGKELKFPETKIAYKVQ